MEHIYNLSNAHLDKPSVVTIGVFDGVHRGHQHLIQQLVQEAHDSDRLAVVLTFFPHPDVVLRGVTGRYYLTHPEQKARFLGELGVDVIITHPFDEQVQQIRAADFVDDLLVHLKLNALWVGSDFALGYKREGNVAYLMQQGAEKGFDLRVVDLVPQGGETISSTRIRAALNHGDLEQVTRWLGRPYEVEGEVVHGASRGRDLGFPTANTAVWEEQVIPANGVYAGWATLNGERFMAAINVGVNPTFGGGLVTVEPYLLDFDRDIYGETLRVAFEKRLREEERFDSIDALIEQMSADVAVTREYLSQKVGR